jgi:hypothetical protein
MGAVIDEIHSDVSVEAETPPVTGITGSAWELREKVCEAQRRTSRDHARISAEGFDD